MCDDESQNTVNRFIFGTLCRVNGEVTGKSSL